MPVNRNSGRVWINFKELRARLRAEDVLALYEIEPKRRGDQHQGACPLPSHAGSNGSASFSMNFERGIFQCFGCKAAGNLLEFAALMDGVDPADGNALRKVAMKLQAKFFPEGANTRNREKPVAKEAPPKPPEMKVAINAPLDFELKGLETNHPSLTGQGYSSETAAYFGIGFCSRGLLKDRLAIPLHDEESRLIGYAGRLLEEEEADRENPLYLFPAKRERNGTVFDFDRSLFLYNGARIKKPCDNLIVVQDFEAVWWLNQNGFPDAVALMGDDCSGRQLEFIVRLAKPGGWIWVMCDGDDAGERLAETLVFELSLHRPVRRVSCGRGNRPSQLSAEQIKSGFLH
jgi:DNA primase